LARPRLNAAARKLAGAIEQQRGDEADQVGAGVRAVAKEIVGEVEPGSLYWRAPLQYIAEQMAPRIVKHHELEGVALDDLRAYLLAGINEYVIALAGEFDREHFEAWIAAMIAAERDRAEAN
jgi:AAA+ superfamily predicted ATPase